MPTLRTHIIDASNSKALPATRYLLQQHNSLQQPKRNPSAIQPVRYVNVMKKVLSRAEQKTINLKKKKTLKIPENPAKKLIQTAKNVWKKGHGSIERVDKKTGDIFHLARKEPVYEQETQIKNGSVNNTMNTSINNNTYKKQLIRVKIPLKISQKKPSELLPQKTIIATNTTMDALPNKSQLLDFKYTTDNIDNTLQHKLDNIVNLTYFMGEKLAKQTQKTLARFKTTQKQAASSGKLALLRNYIN